MIFWSRTEDGWAVNLDGTNAALRYTYPRIELRSGMLGWACACHLGAGSSRLVPLGGTSSVIAAMRAGIEGSMATIGVQYIPDLRRLLEEPTLQG
jgi:hypothetical protein